MKVEKISETLYKFTLTLNEFSVNLAVNIGQDGILMVDTGWGQTVEELKEKIGELSADTVKLIIFTHPHGDHIGGRQSLGKQATLISHKNTRNELAGKYFALDPLPGQELPTIFTEDELLLCFNGEDIKIIPAPGHTNSDMVVYFVDSGAVFMGDLLFSDTYPGLFSGWGGSVDDYIESIGKLIELFPEDIKIIAGHGRDYSLDDLREHLRMAIRTADLIRHGLANGKAPQDMIQEKLLKDWEKWSSPAITTENWITQAYESLSGQCKNSIVEPLTHTIVEKDIAAAIKQYQHLKKDKPDSYDFGENQLNMLGYQLLWRGMTEDAIEVHKLNVQVYPESANPYDSLGESYEASGEVRLAIDSYEKALKLNPDMPSAKEALKRLKATSKD